MTDQEIRKYGEIQYLKGRLDELRKALPNITNMERSRKLDQRVEKYINKLKKVDEVAYYLYEVELFNRERSKEKSKSKMQDLLNEILINGNIVDGDIIDRIKKQIASY